jgi:hypothetical protein
MLCHFLSRLAAGKSAARDDKGKDDDSLESGRWTEAIFTNLGGPQAMTTPVEMTMLFEDRMPRVQEKYEILAATELSSRPERTRISCHAALETTACAAFSKESRMKFANATNINRKSGVA